MVIDLFGASYNATKINQQDAQIEHRKFELDCDVKDIRALDVDPVYKEHILSLVNKPRSYTPFGLAKYDSLYELELLGIGQSCKAYTVVVDLSSHLDYVLHRLSGCPMSAIRGIEDYEHFSSAVLNCDFASTDGTFDKLLNVSPELDAYFESLLEKATTDRPDNRDLVDHFVVLFYNAMQSVLIDLRKNVVCALKSTFDNHGLVYRSKTHTLAICTCAAKIDCSFELVQKGYESCIVDVQSFAAFEYALTYHARGAVAV